ncbi:hypothetical protein D1816_03565 [Aquimarina sp. AD10]|uniref:SGNH/GDSL hydrolase family protein n=1 Tax=Aquimarina sp. AD10 TaxID=1714849 RepID=UPI000E4EBBCE|nr:hypothetical protein [Aquimarina sp. AD10]AXT59467.1 hypothetical protein D1816_03565 [Aquimarina sp. AD10]RKN00368.1 hypothetical protein D7033_08395 [Aquimarina sp. AD10]
MKIRHLSNSIFTTLLLVFLSFGSSVLAQSKKKTLKVLFVGNSYTYVENIPQITSIISDSLQTKLITKKSVIGGAKLRDHWLGNRGLKTKEIIKKNKFDIVVLQEWSLGTIYESDSIRKYAKLFCDLIKDKGAKPYLYQTWAREKVPQHQETIAKVYEEVATANEATIVPVGRAWELAKQLRPTIKLYDADGTHPSRLGAFLSAYTFATTITGEMPGSLSRIYSTNDSQGESVYLMYLDNLDITFFTEVVKKITLPRN